MANKTNDKSTSYKKNNSKRNTSAKSPCDKCTKNTSENTKKDSKDYLFDFFKFKKHKKKRKMPILIKMIGCIFAFCKNLVIQRFGKKDYDKKVYSTQCNFITLSIIVMVCLFIYNGKSLLCAYPLITSVLLFMKFSKGINGDKQNKYYDLKLYKRILKANIFLITFVLLLNYEKFWFFDYTTILIFIVPLFISKIQIGFPFKGLLRIGR